MVKALGEACLTFTRQNLGLQRLTKFKNWIWSKLIALRHQLIRYLSIFIQDTKDTSSTCMFLQLHSRELTYPTLGKGKSSSKVIS